MQGYQAMEFCVKLKYLTYTNFASEMLYAH